VQSIATPLPVAEPWRHGFIRANGIRFHYVEAGDGPLVLLLHGFPEFWYSWRHQIPALATRFRVVAPDLRGYNETEKPQSGYDVRTLVEDVACLVRALGHDRCRLAGHDWGGVIAWATAARYPEIVERLSILNAPHPTAMASALWSSASQRKLSRYIFAFQIPGIPERRFRARNFAILDKSIRGRMVHPERLSEADLDAFKGALARPGALRSTLAYYRAAFRGAIRSGFSTHDVMIRVPTQVIWGEQDFALGVELVQNLSRWVEDLELELLPTAGHWVQQDEPEITSDLMLDFLSR
jgi:pimeloyl-ACP methyl ester carboxylesterase